MNSDDYIDQLLTKIIQEWYDQNWDDPGLEVDRLVTAISERFFLEPK